MSVRVPVLTALERRVVDAIDARDIIDLTAQLVAIRSLGGAESAAQDCVANALRQAGIRVDRWTADLDQLRQHPAYCEEVTRSELIGLVGCVGGSDGGRSLALNGHIDVVGVGDVRQWTVPPWQVTEREGRLFGRGVADMKGAVACAVIAAQALERSGVRLRGQLQIHSVAGEEDGGCGTLAVLQRGYRADAAVVMEPTELGIAPAQAGALNFRISLHGRAAHACVRTEGISAIDRIPRVLSALRALEQRRQEAVSDPLFSSFDVAWPISVGTVRGGEWPSSVPDEVTLEGRFGIAPDEDLAAARAEFEAALGEAVDDEAWQRDHPPVVEWWGGQFAGARIDADAAVVLALAECVEAVSECRPPIRGVTFGSDQRLLVQEGGIPALLFGPGDVRQAHAPDESVPITELVAAARSYALLAMRWCGAYDGGQSPPS